MPTVGEVNAVLSAQDEMTDVIRSATESIDQMRQKFEDSQESSDSLASSITGLGGQLMDLAGIGLSISGTFELVKSSLEFAESLEVTSRAAGMSTDELQRLDYAGQQFGVSADMMARAAEVLSAKLATDNKSTAKAIETLGLDLDNLKMEDSNQRFLDLASAVSQIPDPLEKAGVQAELFGARLGRTLLPAMQDLKSAEESMPAISIISQDQIEAAAAFEHGVKNLWTTIEAATIGIASFYAELLHFKSAADIGAEVTKEFAENERQLKAAEDEVVNGQQNHINSIESLTTHLQSLQKDALIPLSDEEKKQIETWRDMGANAQEMADALHLPVDTIKDFLDQLKKSDDAFAQWAAAWNAVRDAERDFHDVLVEINADTVIAAENALRHGVSQKTVAEAFGLTSTQVKALKDDIKAADDLTKQWIEDEKVLEQGFAKATAAHDALMKQEDATQAASLQKQEAAEEKSLADRFKRGTLNESQYQNELLSTRLFYEQKQEELVRQETEAELAALGAKEEKETEALAQKYDNNKISYEAYQAALNDLDQEYADKRSMINEKADENSASKRQKIWDDFYQKVDKAADASAQHEMQDQQAIQTTAMSMTYDLSTTEGMDEFKKLNPAASINVGPEYFKTHTLQQAIQAGLINLYAGYGGGQGGMPSFEGGGSGDFGSGTIAMLHGKEIITPIEKVGEAGLGGGITNHFYINGTAADLANKISIELMKQLKSIRRFPSA